MIPINNSDTAWLIVSDYNQEHGKFYTDLREDVNDPDVNDWYWGSYHPTVGGCGISEVVGSSDAYTGNIGGGEIVTLLAGCNLGGVEVGSTHGGLDRIWLC